MPIEILMPALSPTMTEGTLATWQKNEGDTISAGDVIAEIETDKATMEFEAVDEGTLGRILISAGTEGVAVNTPIGLLLAEGEDASALEGYAPKGATKPAASAAESGSAQEGPAAAAPPAAAAAPVPSVSETGTAPPAPKTASGGRIFASPLARRIAAQKGVDLAALTGSGPHGRIVKADVDGAAGAPRTAAAATATAGTTGAAKAVAPVATGKDQVVAMAGNIPYREVPNSGMRKTIARRLAESKQQAPHFYLTVDCQLDALLALRKDLNERGAPDGLKLSVNDLIIKACAAALRKVPAANASWTDDAILYWEQVDISVAVAIEGGLITPIIKQADRKGLGTISAEVKDLAARARDGKLKPEEYQGGTFSLSNLGMFGIKDFSAVINPPQGCILAVGAGEQRPVVKDGALAVATVMSCTLSVDHRVVDGAVGAEFLAAFKKLVEDPISMML